MPRYHFSPLQANVTIDLIMAPIEENRAQPGISQKSRKRQRVGFEKANPLSRKELSSNAVSLDTLLWNKVSFPEQFEDAEGFFGLEEISDVDVARDPKVGKVEYRVCYVKEE